MCPHDWGKKIILGNLNNEKFLDIWFSSKFMKIRENLNNSKEILSLVTFVMLKVLLWGKKFRIFNQVK